MTDEIAAMTTVDGLARSYRRAAGRVADRVLGRVGPDATPAVAATTVTALVSIAFALVRPPVGDLFAAQARAQAASDGVGLHYWFSWFSGMVPGNYSVLTPYLYRIVGPVWVGVAATVATVALTSVLVRGSRRPAVATWCAALVMSLNLWAGRVPFAVGAGVMVAALLAVRADRRWWSAIAAATAALCSPVAGAFLALGLAGVFVHDRARRMTAFTAAAAAGVTLLGLGVYFGMPGPEGYPPLGVLVTLAAAAPLLLARLPGEVRLVVVLALALTPVVALVPNGMGANFGRLVWICLPVAVAATGQVPSRRRVALAVVPALVLATFFTTWSVALATHRTSSEQHITGLVHELESLDDLRNYRVENVDNGTHLAAAALPPVAQLPGGFETQARNRYRTVLDSPSLTAASFRSWLDDNAVGYVVLARHPVTETFEDDLVRHHRPDYLTETWSDADWTLFAVDDPTPIVGEPAGISRAEQDRLVVNVPSAGRYPLRVHWSRFLRTDTENAHLEPSDDGWSVLVAHRPGYYVVTG